jgi:hypothetical protein
MRHMRHASINSPKEWGHKGAKGATFLNENLADTAIFSDSRHKKMINKHVILTIL